MQAYYTDEERSFFWRSRDDDKEESGLDTEKKDIDDSEMASQADVDTIYKNANKIEDYYKGITKFFPLELTVFLLREHSQVIPSGDKAKS